MPQHVQLKFLFIKSLVSMQQQKMALELPLSSAPHLPFSNAARAGILDLASSLHCSSITKSCILCSLEHDSSIACHPMPCLPSTASCQCYDNDCLTGFLFLFLPLYGSLPTRRPVAIPHLCAKASPGTTYPMGRNQMAVFRASVFQQARWPLNN